MHESNNNEYDPSGSRIFRRSSGDRIFGGVCGGLGRYWNIDPIILRVAFGVSLLVGASAFMYLAFWMLVLTTRPRRM